LQLQDLKLFKALLLTLSAKVLKVSETALHLFKVCFQVCEESWDLLQLLLELQHRSTSLLPVSTQHHHLPIHGLKEKRHFRLH
ncbi:hypothetical protein DNTS_021636, partial [Danionella cerebrum]